MQAIIASGPVIIKNKKVLLIKDKKDDFYKFPGGTVKQNEALEKACIRETKEEIGVDIKIKKPLVTMLLWKRPGKKQKIAVILVHYLAKIKNEKIIRKGKNIKEIRWIKLNEIKKFKVAPNVLYVLKYHKFIK